MKTLQASREADSPYAWTRLWVALALVTIGGSGMYSMAVVLPPLQAEFGIARADATGRDAGSFAKLDLGRCGVRFLNLDVPS